MTINADDVVPFSQDVGDWGEMFGEFNMALEKNGMTMNLNETKIMPWAEKIVTRLWNHIIERVEDYIYLKHIIKLGRDDQATGKLNDSLGFCSRA